MIASVLSKKIAAGSTHLVLDMPVGDHRQGAQHRSGRKRSAQGLLGVAEAFGIEARVVIGDGTQPIGRGIGPALEARDVLAVLQGRARRPARSARPRRDACRRASGAWRCGAGGWRARRLPRNTLDRRPCLGKVSAHLRGAGRHARAAGRAASASARRRARRTSRRDRQSQGCQARQARRRAGRQGARVCCSQSGSGTASMPGAPLCTVHAEAPGELAYALDYAAANPGIITIGEDG